MDECPEGWIMSLALFTGRAVDTHGNARSNKSITVTVVASGANASLFSDTDGAVAKTNPLTTSADGSFSFYAVDDDYTITDDNGATIVDATLRSGATRGEFKYKTGDETVNDSDTLQADDDLKTCANRIQAGETWDIEMVLRLQCAFPAAGFKFDFTVPAGATYSYKFGQHWQIGGAITVANVFSSTLSTEESFANIGDLTVDIMWLTATIVNGATTGAIGFRWAQSIAVAADTKVLADSYALFRRVG